MGRVLLLEVWKGQGTLQKVRNRSGDPSKGTGWSGDPTGGPE